uniref:Uncharacterized protein n=1 Tax=Spongospora subterranea TaxID=70186 RepID=A0A0H5R441_9EUKA|eukprot:CRZ08649.1 hypothetical protein [Spongospora subterranea]
MIKDQEKKTRRQTTSPSCPFDRRCRLVHPHLRQLVHFLSCPFSLFFANLLITPAVFTLSIENVSISRLPFSGGHFENCYCLQCAESELIVEENTSLSTISEHHCCRDGCPGSPSNYESQFIIELMMGIRFNSCLVVGCH